MISYVLASAIVTLTIPAPEKVDIDRLLDAISDVEHWDGKTPGGAGEWGPWQMLPTVWKHARGASKKTLRQATPSELRAAARDELLYRMATLEINHMTASPFLLGLAWTAGLEATIQRTTSQAKRDYANRVEAIYKNARTRDAKRL